VYSIGAVARMVGVTPSTLRTWEDRYGLVVPERSAGGHRLYSRDQVEQLHFLAGAVTRGASPADAHRLLAERLSAAAPLTTPADDVGLMVLLAERDPHAAGLAEFFLRTEGFDTRTVTTVEEAEAEVAARAPQVAVVDLLISGGEGLGLCRSIAGRGATAVVALSPLSSRDAALDAGADAFLRKPIDPLALVSTVRDLLRRSAHLRSGDRT
jgi:DNA-binding transcriptional MerR regulator